MTEGNIGVSSDNTAVTSNPVVNEWAIQKQSQGKLKEKTICAHTTLRGIYTNARSLANIIEELELLLHEED